MKMVNTKNLQMWGNICAEVRINLGKTLLRMLNTTETSMLAGLL